MEPKLLPKYGCSQEDHVPNCGHFGFSGEYLGRHLLDCFNEQDARYECSCNPKARSKRNISVAVITNNEGRG